MFMKRKLHTRKLPLVVFGVLAVLGTGAYMLARSPTGPLSTEFTIKNEDFQILGVPENQEAVLAESETSKIIESLPIKADFEFNAIAPHWKETNATEENRKLELRISSDEQNWGPWIEVEAVGPLRDDDPHPDRMYTETPLLIGGRYFQYRISLNRESLDDPSPQVFDLKVSQIDSRKPSRVVRAEKIKGIFKGNKAYAAQQHPRIITRSEWGSPDPYGEYFKGTDKHWPQSYVPVKQVFIHHTVTANYEADPSAAMRAIWDFHANTRGWGDIGYNYLVDHQGNVYQGRFGGDNVVAGHVLNYNRGSLGVALLGCFDSTNQTCRELNGGSTPPPADHVLGSLSSLLSNKMTAFEINPLGSSSICDVNNENCLNLPTITGHRDANSTTCPGDLTVTRLQDIRNLVSSMNSSGWTYSAKQLSYGLVDMSTNDSVNVTLNFKNTGANAWTSSQNTMSLFTMEPAGRNSAFQGNGWPAVNKPAVLNEALVNPGQTGSFTFNVKRPNLPNGDYYEPITLITADGNTPGGYYMLRLRIGCTIGQASNPRANGLLIRSSLNGSVYLIEDGKKRYITSPLAAISQGIDLNYTVDVTSQEIGLLTDGEPISLGEGTLIKGVSSPRVYILDKTVSGYQRRYVTSAAAMSAFGLKFGHIVTLSDGVIAGYPEGIALTDASAVPDGRIIKSVNDHKIYKVEDGKKRWISSVPVFTSYNYLFENVVVVGDQKTAELPSGTDLPLRTGTLIKTTTSPSVYVIDVVNGIGYRRLVTSSAAFEASGFYPWLIQTVSQATIDGYLNSLSVECHK